MRTREEFIARWRSRAVMIGMDALRILNGPQDLRGGPEKKAQTLMSLPVQIDELLGKMWDDLQPPKPEPPKQAPAASANGQPQVKR